jgi:hypothetical protein
MSAVNHVNRVNRVNNVNDVNDVKTPTSAAYGGVSAVRPPTAAFRLSVSLRRRFGCPSACGGVSGVRRLRRRFGGTPPAAAFRGYAACGGGFF